VARKKKADVATGYQIMIEDTIDEKPMTQEEREKAVQSLNDTVAKQAEQVKEAINLSEIVHMVTDPSPDGFVARMKGKTIEAPKTEQIEMDLVFPDKEETRRKHIKEAHERRILAQNRGAFEAGETALATISEKNLGFDYFTSAVIKMLPEGIENYILDEQGRINLYDLTMGKTPIEEVLQEVDQLHTAFLMWLLAVAWNTEDIREKNSGNAIMPIYLPKILADMGIDPRPHEWDKETGKNKKRDSTKTMAELRLNKFMEFINPLRNVAAFFGGDLYQIVGFYQYNVESETMFIAAPYMYRLVEYAKLNASKHAAIQNIFHADIMTENQIAVEVANRIAMGLIQRGVTRPDYNAQQPEKKLIKKRITKTDPDGGKIVEEMNYAPETETTITKSWTDENGITKTVTGRPREKERIFTFKIRFSALIEDCPQLKNEIDKIRNSTEEHKPQKVNNKLRDVFGSAIRIIMEKSEIPRYYKDLTIRTGKFDYFKAPTYSALNDLLIISHKGKA